MDKLCTQDINLDDNIKHISFTKYRLKEALFFSLDLLNYKQKSNFTTRDVSFDQKGNLLKLEYFASYIDKNTGELRINKHNTTLEYESEKLKKEHFFRSDTSWYNHDYFYSYDEKKRLTKIDKHFTSENTTNDLSGSEKITYDGKNRLSTVYIGTDTSRMQRVTYDSKDRIISWEAGFPIYTFAEYYYNKDGLIDVYISGGIGQNSFSKTGNYVIYKYTKRGVIKKQKHYILIVTTANGKDKYWKGNLHFTKKYKEKRKGSYIFRTTKMKSVNKPSKVSRKQILDSKRNTILDYNTEGKFSSLSTYKITYY